METVLFQTLWPEWAKARGSTARASFEILIEISMSTDAQCGYGGGRVTGTPPLCIVAVELSQYKSRRFLGFKERQSWFAARCCAPGASTAAKRPGGAFVFASVCGMCCANAAASTCAPAMVSTVAKRQPPRQTAAKRKPSGPRC